MLTKGKPAAPIERAGDAPDISSDSSIENLRQILLRDQIEEIRGLEADLDRLEHQIGDERALVKMIAPVLGEAIRLKIREARDEMIEALYPIIGQVVQRAVMEAVSDLARSLDAQVKTSFDLRLAWWRIKARLSGAPEEQIRLRELLPFTVTDVLLIHRESGLLLAHLTSDPSGTPDTDLFSGMLTAIGDFARDTLGGEEQERVGEITYGNQRILIEAAQHVYLAAITGGITPPEFRAEMREHIIEIEHAYTDELRSYQGNAQSLASSKEILRPLMVTASPGKLSGSQKRFLAGALGALIIFLAACGFFTNWMWRFAHQTPAAPVIIIQPAATLTAAPSATAAPTATLIPSPTITLTFTPLPPTPIVGVILGDVWVHTGPSADTPRSGTVLRLGEQVEIVALHGEWVQVQQVSPGQNEVTGWIPARWLGMTNPVPAQVVTPSSIP